MTTFPSNVFNKAIKLLTYYIVSSLKGLTNLSMFYLNNNKISDISVLKELTNLTNLDLSNNKISDISALKKLTHLNSLNLNGNPISNADKEALKKELLNCIITFE
ncbi:leucine-rich repeat domain-containing protein [Clostridium sp. OS1-26]|uniref:leucine-rich repeat domain-containing protein n=1 Tax=Clostridium sp. OS1-26 TaxID=3070681 RepID=UPI0027E0ADA4|nr:leucine-rich repeat domain-containing protein [Clostridium sp. OS1-26]WML33005.1 leucine-rich repeat domain-containing protein [Clostridium sp. OS1-26]